MVPALHQERWRPRRGRGDLGPSPQKSGRDTLTPRSLYACRGAQHPAGPTPHMTAKGRAMGLFGKKKYDNVWDEYTEGGRLQPAPSAYDLEQLTPEQRKQLKKARRPDMIKSTKDFEKRQKQQRKAEKKADKADPKAPKAQPDQGKKKKSGWW